MLHVWARAMLRPKRGRGGTRPVDSMASKQLKLKGFAFLENLEASVNASFKYRGPHVENAERAQSHFSHRFALRRDGSPRCT